METFFKEKRWGKVWGIQVWGILGVLVGIISFCFTIYYELIKREEPNLEYSIVTKIDFLTKQNLQLLLRFYLILLTYKKANTILPHTRLRLKIMVLKTLQLMIIITQMGNSV